MALYIVLRSARKFTVRLLLEQYSAVHGGTRRGRGEDGEVAGARGQGEGEEAGQWQCGKMGWGAQGCSTTVSAIVQLVAIMIDTHLLSSQAGGISTSRFGTVA